MNFEASMFGSEERLALPGEERRAGRIWWIVGTVALMLAVLVGAYFMFHRSSTPTAGTAGGGQAPAAQSGQIPTVSVAAPGVHAIDKVVSGTGSLAAKFEMPVGVAGEGGMITRVLVEPGDWVKAGQVLAMIDRSVQVQTAATLAANVRVAQADAEVAQSELERAQSLVGRGFISKADLQRKTADRDQAMARVKAAQASLAETAARNARLDIRSPSNGLVLTRGVEAGQIVSSGSGMLFRVATDGIMELRVQLSQGDLLALHPGSPAEVTPVGATKVFHGKVWQVSPVVDPQTRQGIARIELAFDPALRPGGFASARIVAGATQAPLLPQSAVQSDAKGNFVYILDSENRVQRRSVTTGDVSDQGVLIPTGLVGNERVVLTAGAFLNPGQKVIPNLRKLN